MQGGGPPDPADVFLGLGSNVGDRMNFLRCGLAGLAARQDVQLLACSRVWESEYVGPGVQDAYLNLVCRIKTSLVPIALLDVCQGIERERGRRADSHMQPRTLDIDLLLYGCRTIQRGRLRVPHPRLGERGFVLAPLAELAPEMVLPDSRETAAAAWARIRGGMGSWLRPWSSPIVDPLPVSAGKEEWRAALAVHCR